MTAWTLLAKTAGKSHSSSKWLCSGSLPPKVRATSAVFPSRYQPWMWISSELEQNWFTCFWESRRKRRRNSTTDSLPGQITSFTFFSPHRWEVKVRLIKSQEWSSGQLSSHQRNCWSIHLVSDPPSACWKELKANSPWLIQPYEQQLLWLAFLDGFLLHTVKPTWRVSSGSVAGRKASGAQF